MGARWNITRDEAQESVSDRRTLTTADVSNGDGTGSILGTGAVDYDDGGVTTLTNVPLLRTYSREAYSTEIITDAAGEAETGSWSTANESEELVGQVSVRYALASATPGTAITEQVAVPSLRLQLLPDSSEQWQPGTLRFRLGSKAYIDGGGGVLYLSDGATVAGSIDYAARTVSITNWTGAGTTVYIDSLVTTPGAPSMLSAVGRTAGDPLSVGQFFVRATTLAGDEVIGQGQSDQSITGDGIADGTVLWDIGAFWVQFDEPVYPLARYDTVVQEVLPLSQAQTGIDASTLPRDGRVPIYRQSDAVLLHETAEAAMPNPLAAGQVVDIGVEELAWVELLDAGGAEQYETLPSGLTAGQTYQVLAARNAADRVCEYLLLRDADGRHVAAELFSAEPALGRITMASPLDLTGYAQPLRARYVRRVAADMWTADLEAGTVTMADPLDLAGRGYTQPLRRRVRWEDWSRLLSVDPSGVLKLQNTPDHDYSTAGQCSTVVENGNLRARVSVLFGQTSWSPSAQVWQDTVSGTEKAIYDSLNYPPLLTNRGAITGRMAIYFTSASTFSLYIEGTGAVASGTKSADFSPINPASRTADRPDGVPYLTLWAAGWSADTATGNVLRLNTISASAPLWAALCVSAGDPVLADDAFELELRVDAD